MSVHGAASSFAGTDKPGASKPALPQDIAAAVSPVLMSQQVLLLLLLLQLRVQDSMTSSHWSTDSLPVCLPGASSTWPSVLGWQSASASEGCRELPGPRNNLRWTGVLTNALVKHCGVQSSYWPATGTSSSGGLLTVSSSGAEAPGWLAGRMFMAPAPAADVIGRYLAQGKTPCRAHAQ